MVAGRVSSWLHVKLAILAAIVLAALAAPAAAGTLADALARHAPRDVDALRARRDDPAARCTLGAVYARRGDRSRAALYLAGCDDLALPDEISAEIARIARDLARALRDSDLAMIEVVTRPEGMTAEIDALPGDPFTTPATLYLVPGRYTVRATGDGLTLTSPVTAARRSRGVVVIEAPPRRPDRAAPTNHAVDFSHDAAAERRHTGPPPDVQHGTLLPDNYRRGVTATATAPASAPEAIADPLATTHAPARAPRPLWLGLRLGGGALKDGELPLRAGFAVAITARVPINAWGFVPARVEWIQRGGSPAMGDAAQALGASAGFGFRIVRTARFDLAFLLQLGVDRRLGDRPGLERNGINAGADVELAFANSPLTAGLRLEHGLTPLIDDHIDGALMLEVGVDWR